MGMTVPASATTGELTLRPWTDEDAQTLVEVYQDPVLRRWTRLPVTTADEARQWLDLQKQGLEAGTRISFAVEETNPTGRSLVANVVLKLDTGEPACGEVGFWTAAPGRGRGIAPAAVKALTRWAFDDFAGATLDRLELLHNVHNHASCRVAEKTGYVFSRVLSPPPWSPDEGHLHVRTRRASDQPFSDTTSASTPPGVSRPGAGES